AHVRASRASAGGRPARPAAASVRRRPRARARARPALGELERLDLEELLESPAPQLPSPTRLLVPAERRHGVEAAHAAHVDLTGAQAAGDPLGPAAIAGEDGPVQAVGRVVGDADGVVLVVAGDDRHDGPEDLVDRNGHVVVDVGEDRGPYVVAPLE